MEEEDNNVEMHEIDIRKFNSNYGSVASDKNLVFKSRREKDKEQDDKEMDDEDGKIEFVPTTELQTQGENMWTERPMQEHTGRGLREESQPSTPDLVGRNSLGPLESRKSGDRA